MSYDVTALFDAAVVAVTILAFALAAVRAFQFRRALAGRAHRSLANLLTLFGVVMVVILLVVYLPIYPTTFDSDFAVTLARLVFVMVVYGFLDRIILVVLETDFLHRDTLRWRRGRILAYAVLAIITLVSSIVSIAFGFNPLINPFATSNPWGWPSLTVVFSFVIAIALWGYFLAVILVGARRSPDAIVRKNVQWIVLSFIALFSALPFGLLLLLAHDLFDLICGILFYRAVTYISPLGQIERSRVGPN